MIRKIIGFVFLGWAVIFGLFYYERYFKWRGCFNDLGRCYDSESGLVYLEQAGIVWLSLLILSLGISLYLFWRSRQLSREKQNSRILK